MTTGGIIAVAFLAILIGLVLWNIRGHRERSGRDHQDGWHSGSDGHGGAD